jgi:hypothetical protein
VVPAAGVAERLLPRDDWRLFRDWGWHGAEPDTDPDCARQIADLSRPGALAAGLNWYRANLSRNPNARVKWISGSDGTGVGVVPEFVRDGMDEFDGFLLREGDLGE